MLGLAVFGLPAYFVGWGAGRWCLRRALDPARLPRVPEPQLRATSEPVTMPLSMCTEPPTLWSEHRAQLDATEREVRQMIAEAGL